MDEIVEDALASLVDAYGLGRLLIALANVCADRSEVLACHDAAQAKWWLAVSVASNDRREGSGLPFACRHVGRHNNATWKANGHGAGGLG
jgi:hypothetical protein